MEWWIGILILGFAVGLISAFLGLGGGILIVPLLPTLGQIGVKETVATSLLSIFLIVTNNTISFHRKKLIQWKIALLIGPCTAIGAFATVQLTKVLPDLTLRGILFFILVLFLIRSFLPKPQGPQSSEGEVSKQQIILAILVGVFAGALSGISGVGSGIILSPLLIGLALVKSHKVSPTSNAIMVFTTFFGVLGFLPAWSEVQGMRWGLIHGDMAIMIVLVAFVTSFWGRKYQSRMPDSWRKKILIGLLLFLTLKVGYNVYTLWQTS